MDKISAREAFDKGLTRYFTGKECKKGHIAQRMISNGSCVECLKRETAYRRTKEWRKEHPGARTIEARKYRERHPDKVRANSLRYRHKNIESIRIKGRDNARRMRAINPEKEKLRLKKWAEKQEKKRIEIAGRPKAELCEICNGNEFKIVFDHCHQSGKV